MSGIDGSIYAQSGFFIQDPNAAGIAQSVFDDDATSVVDGSGTLSGYDVDDAYRNDVSPYEGNGGVIPPTFGYFVAENPAPAVIVGNGPGQAADAYQRSFASPSTTYGVLAGLGATYRTGLSGTSVIVAGDETASAVVNDNPDGGLIAYTGTGGNALVGQGTINAFNTADGGSDAVSFDANETALQLNVLNSQGQDNVAIDAPYGDGAQYNFVTAIGGGADAVFLNGGADLTFINDSTASSTITATDGSIVLLGGGGGTTIQASPGGETFGFLNLPGLGGGVDTIVNFTADDLISLSAGTPYSVAAVNGSTVVTTGNDTQIVVLGIADPSLVGSRIVTG